MSRTVAINYAGLNGNPARLREPLIELRSTEGSSHRPLGLGIAVSDDYGVVQLRVHAVNMVTRLYAGLAAAHCG